MTEYNFYYDESEHSRKINFNTVSAANYYDNFIAMIVGWPIEGEDILQRYAAFEAKYAGRKDRNGEIKVPCSSKNNLGMGLPRSTSRTYSL